MDNNLKDILAAVNFIKDHMLTKEEGATKDDIRAIAREELQNLVPAIIANEVKDIRADIKEIHGDILQLHTDILSHAGFAKEIDYGFKRIARIEKHLGLQSEIPG